MEADRLVRAALLFAALPAAAAAAEAPIYWGVQVEQLEGRFGDAEAFAWDGDAFVGTDELKLVLRSEAELEHGAFEALENQLRLQTPVSTFFDAVAGVRLDTPEGGPDRVHAVLGVHGLARQWFEVDADLFLSDHPSARFEAEYEALITNRVILVPSLEVDLPLADDEALDLGGFAPKVEIGARLGYDLVDRAVAPYVGVHYERRLGESADRTRRAGGDADALSVVLGVRLMY
ncbi:MAG: copper resistance protein B [Paracoccaceae bacterium]